MAFKVAFVVVPVVLAVLVVSQSMSYPLHAQCTIHWKFKIPCQNVSDALQNQIKKWTGPDGCDQGGEKCLYKLKSVTNTTLKATHTTPVKKYVDDLTFTFKLDLTDSGCLVLGHSTSEVFYAVLDYGTNYCNLHNLITGSKLDKAPGYNETTTDSVCTQYSSADCEKY